MGTTLCEFSSYLAKTMQPGLFQDLFINGIQVEGASVIGSFAVAVSASLAIIERAVEADVDLLLTHHGLIQKGRELVLVGSAKDKVRMLLENDITLMTYHLPLDAHEEFGNCFPAARLLGAERCAPFIVDAMVVGVLAHFAPRSRDEFKKQLEHFYGHEGHCAFGGKEMISSVAIVSGKGYKFLADAAKLGVDAFVTGSFDEPLWHTAFEEKINFFACGHSATEHIGVRLLGEHLSRHFSIPHIYLHDDNPF